MSAVTATKSSVVMTASQVETPAQSTANAQEFGLALRREIDRKAEGRQGGKMDGHGNNAVAIPASDSAQEQAISWLLMLQQLPGNVAQPIVQDDLAVSDELLDGGDDRSVLAGLLHAQLQQRTGSNARGGQAEEASELPVEQASVTDRQGGLPRMGAANLSDPGGKNLPRYFDGSEGDTPFGEFLQVARDVHLQPPVALPAASAHGIEQARAVSQASTLARFAVEEPVGNGRWGEVVAQRVSLMLGRQEQQMEMQLTPPNLGPMEVRLTLGADQASVVFASQHAAVREALVAATPRLTALLAEQGIQLVNVQVASDSLQQQTQGQMQQQSHWQGADDKPAQAGRQAWVNHPLAETGSAGSPVAVALPVARSGVSLYI